MKKVFSCAIFSLLKLSGYRLIIAGSTLCCRRSGTGKVKMKSKGSMTNGSRSATGKSSKRSNVAQTPRPPLTKAAATAAANKKARQDKLDAEATADKKRDQSSEVATQLRDSETKNWRWRKKKPALSARTNYGSGTETQGCANRCGAI